MSHTFWSSLEWEGDCSLVIYRFWTCRMEQSLIWCISKQRWTKEGIVEYWHWFTSFASSDQHSIKGMTFLSRYPVVFSINSLRFFNIMLNTRFFNLFKSLEILFVVIFEVYTNLQFFYVFFLNSYGFFCLNT